MHPLSKLLLAVALLLGVVGVGLALVQPGDLGDGDTETAGPATTSTTASDDDPAAPTSTTTAGGDDGEGDGDGEPTTTAPTTTEAGEEPATSAPTTSTTEPGGSVDDGPDAGGQGTTTTTSAPTAPGPGTGGSGLDGGSSDAPSDLEDGLADTGGTPLLGAAVGLAALALALPRRRA